MFARQQVDKINVRSRLGGDKKDSVRTMANRRAHINMFLWTCENTLSFVRLANFLKKNPKSIFLSIIFWCLNVDNLFNFCEPTAHAHRRDLVGGPGTALVDCFPTLLWGRTARLGERVDPFIPSDLSVLRWPPEPPAVPRAQFLTGIQGCYDWVSTGDWPTCHSAVWLPCVTQ